MAPISAAQSPSPHRRRPRRQGWRAPDLPQYYYHTNFCEFLDFVDQHYRPVFRASEQAFLNEFSALGKPAQCAFIRIAGRKGQVFDKDKLSYPEIEALETQWDILRKANFVKAVEAPQARMFYETLTKPELVALLGDHVCRTGYKASWKKGVLVDTALTLIDFDDLSLPENYIVQGRIPALRFLHYLYFGKIEDNLQAFTLRDLGLIKAPDFKDDYTPRFDDPLEAETCYFYADALRAFKTRQDDTVAAIIDSSGTWPSPVCDTGFGLRDKLVGKLGGLSERLGDVDTALALYGLSDTPLCNERVIRLRWSRRCETQDDEAWCKARLEFLIDAPGSDTEAQFAEDFYSRKFEKKRTSAVTDMLRGSEQLSLDEAYRNTPERAVCAYYERQGYTVFHAENRVWKMLFGLVFWDILFGAESDGFHNPFSRMPAGLRAGIFYDTHTEAIETALGKMQDPRTRDLRILKTLSAHHGTANGVFRWSARTLKMVQALLEVAPYKPLVTVLRKMSRDYRHMKDGFPDLMRIKDGAVDFIEVKADGDVIRRNQLTRLKQLNDAGFTASILRVTWTVDPNQIYVVVDVETTGGKSGNNGITEIGAVKIQNGKTIDTYSTLVNPGRAIPAHITRLTGISDAMVADAPPFKDLADAFRAFLDGGIFVAHNVNFDYGFFSLEYSRINERFSYPKLCTCSSMRRFYPGHKSYSLKNLCLDYSIKLTSHHRALCDAEAAAELLHLINDARRE